MSEQARRVATMPVALAASLDTGSGIESNSGTVQTGFQASQEVHPRRVNSGEVDLSRPQDYVVVSVSMYVEDIRRVDVLVERMRKLGLAPCSRSRVIRLALQRLAESLDR